jgi:cytoskeletal protein CcmA (bactofilin family)
MAMGFFRRGRDDHAGGEAAGGTAFPSGGEAVPGAGANPAVTATADLGSLARPDGDPVTTGRGAPPSDEETKPACDDAPNPLPGALLRPSRRETRMTSVPLRHDGPAETCIGSGSHILGTLNFEASVRVEGNVEGDIVARGSIVVGESAVVKAQLTADTIVVAGKVTGDLVARSRVEVRAPGELHGNISTPSLVIHDGVVFEGRCSMGRMAGESARAPRGSESREPTALSASVTTSARAFTGP